MALISLAEWCRRNNADRTNARKKARNGLIPAFKIGRDWVIDEDFQPIDNRVKNGEYIGVHQKYYEKK